VLEQFTADPAGQPFGGRIFNRQQPAFVGRKDPAAVLEPNGDLGRSSHAVDDRAGGGRYPQQPVLRGEKHAVIETRHDLRQQVTELDEIDDHAMRIGLTLDIGADQPVVAVHGLTEVIGERDEVAGTEDMHRLAETDGEAFVAVVPCIHGSHGEKLFS